MPRLADPAAQFAFLREAAFMLVLDRGPGALSRRALAKALGIDEATVRRMIRADVDLRVFAADEVSDRRRKGRWQRPRGTPAEQAVTMLRQLLPDAPERISEELVALKLTVDLAPPPAPAPAPTGQRDADAGADALTLAERGRLGLTGRWPERSTVDEPTEAPSSDASPREPGCAAWSSDSTSARASAS